MEKQRLQEIEIHIGEKTYLVAPSHLNEDRKKSLAHLLKRGAKVHVYRGSKRKLAKKGKTLKSWDGIALIQQDNGDQALVVSKPSRRYNELNSLFTPHPPWWAEKIPFLDKDGWLAHVPSFLGETMRTPYNFFKTIKSCIKGSQKQNGFNGPQNLPAETREHFIQLLEMFPMEMGASTSERPTDELLATLSGNTTTPSQNVNPNSNTPKGTLSKQKAPAKDKDTRAKRRATT